MAVATPELLAGALALLRRGTRLCRRTSLPCTDLCAPLPSTSPTPRRSARLRSGCATTSVSPKWPGAVGAPSPLSPPAECLATGPRSVGPPGLALTGFWIGRSPRPRVDCLLGIPTPTRPPYLYRPVSSHPHLQWVGASVSYSGQYSTLWPWQPQFESGYRHQIFCIGSPEVPIFCIGSPEVGSEGQVAMW